MDYLVFAKEYKNIIPDNVIKAYEISQKSVKLENKGTSDDLYVFVDNSNFFIQAYHSICRIEHMTENSKIFLDYGRLA
ncbi:14227_t:CDS:2 [Funneliformis caledonium]|uniref:14227_t:CDS:1 n=1 Tax=Funneliformis caledonium TaxID=1117310 RepID=A0A9N8W5J8_9GLOM|nr:14227_t:CDS:2 [Funneliformis caledonium]